MTFAAELAFALGVVQRAAAPALAGFRRADLPESKKPDGSIVTQGDLDVNELIVRELRAGYPGDAILSEEGPQDAERLDARRCWTVDPIDGTSLYARKQRHWSIMLALVVDGAPVVGAVTYPLLGETYAAAPGRAPTRAANGQTRELRAAPLDGGPLRVRHTAAAAALAQHGGGQGAAVFTKSWHGAFMLVSLLASGDHAFVTTGRTGHDWDLAPYAAMLCAAGGVVTDLAGREHRFNRPQTRVRGGVIAAVSPAAHARTLPLVEGAELTPELP